MKQFFKRLLPVMLACLFLFAALPASFAEENADTPQNDLSFREDGTFTVLILADLQDTQFVSPLLIDSVNGVLTDYKPDLVVLLGDQLEGSSPVIRLGSGVKNAQTAIERVLAPIVDSGIPFAVVFGNHDHDAPLSVRTQATLYEAHETCLGVCYGSNLSDSGAFALSVRTNDQSDVALELYFFDDGAYAKNGDYGAVSAAQVAWYREKSAALIRQNGGSAVPSIAFSHVMPAEVYELFTKVEKGVTGAFSGVGVGKGKYYLPNEKRIFLGEVNEAPCPSSENYGLFDAFVENGDVFMSVSGHDHINNFIGTLSGIDLVSAPGATYTSYGKESVRGVRLFRFTEHNVRDYETLHVPFSDYNTPARFGYIRYYLTTTTRIPNAAKILILAVLLVAALTVLCVWGVKKHKRRAIEPLEAEQADPGFDDEHTEK